jgi:hypothetical protein
MSAGYWDVDISDSFEHPLNPDDWSAGAPPGPFDDAILDATGATFTVGDRRPGSEQHPAFG